MNYEYEIGTYTEDDRIKELPEEYKRMTPEEKRLRWTDCMLK